MKLFTALLALALTLAFSGCATGIVERRVPAKSSCCEESCSVKKHN